MTSQVKNVYGVFKKRTILDRHIGATLPEAYKKFYREWKLTEPTAVHYIPEEGDWKRNELTNEVFPIQNTPIPLKYPAEHDQQIWGGEGIVQGFQIRDEKRRRVPHFWMPRLKRSVVYSEVLNKYISVVVTSRTIRLIHANYGFDHYILKTPACDLKSLLPLALKRLILKELQEGCPIYTDQPEKQKEIHERYKQYLQAYTPEEIEWYGYSFKEACNKFKAIQEAEKPIPKKHIFRSQLIERLKAAGIREAEEMSEAERDAAAGSWLQKINPFGRKQET